MNLENLFPHTLSDEDEALLSQYNGLKRDTYTSDGLVMHEDTRDLKCEKLKVKKLLKTLARSYILKHAPLNKQLNIGILDDAEKSNILSIKEKALNMYEILKSDIEHALDFDALDIVVARASEYFSTNS